MPSSRVIPDPLITPTRVKVATSITAAALTLLAAAACSSNAKTPASAVGAAAATTAPASSAPAPAMVRTASSAVGTHLVDGQGRALYVFLADTSTASTCYGSCATYWPPLLTSGAPQASGQAQASSLGTTQRKDGTTQVTYKGHPLYYFALDKAAGDTKGQGSSNFGAKWWLVAPDGSSITGSGNAGSSSSNGYTY